MKENDEIALVTLIATQLHPDINPDLSRAEIEHLLATSEEVTDDERKVFESIDPLTLIRSKDGARPVISFPAQEAYEELPMAAGFYRGGEEKDADEKTRESIKKRRAAIREQIRKKSIKSEESGQDD